MQGNPFFVAPGNDLGPALSGLSNTMSNIRQERMVAAEQQKAADKEAAALARMQEAQAASQAAFQSGDPTEVARASLQFPEIREGLTAAIGLVDDAKQKEAGDFAKRLLLANPADRSSIYQERISTLTDQGRDPSHTVQSFKNYSSNPNGELQALESTWAAIAPKEYMVLSDQKKAEARADEAAAKAAAEESRFVRGEAGKNSRASLNAADRSLTREIAALTAKQNAEMNEMKRQELGLKLEEKQAKLSQNKADIQRGVDAAITNIESGITAADNLLNHPGFESAVGRSSMLPTIPGGDSADFLAELESFNAKTFLSSVAQMKGMGALTDAEGAKLVAAAGAVKPGMSEPALKKSLQTIKDVMGKAKSKLAGSSTSMSHPSPSATPAAGDVSDGYVFLGGDPADPASWRSQ